MACALAIIVAPGCSRQQSALETSSPSPAPISTGDYPAYGHAPDYAWLAGRFSRNLASGDCAYVIFSSTTAAPWGGKIALEAAPSVLAAFSDGDMIVAHGDFDRAPAGTCGHIAYAAKRLEEH